MRRKLVNNLFLFFGIFCALSCSEKKILQNDLDQNNRKIHTIEQATYNTKQELQSIKACAENYLLCKSVRIFDKQGRNINSMVYDSDASLLEYRTIEYDSESRIKTVNKFYPGGTLDFRLEFKYDKNGNTIGQRAYESNDDVKFRWEYKYENNSIERSEYDSNGKIYGKLKEVYDSKGRLKEEVRYNTSYGFKIRNAPIYGVRGYFLDDMMILSSDSLEENIVYYIDQRGDIIEQKIYCLLGAKLGKKELLKYDENGNCELAIFYDKKEKEKEVWECGYDEKDNLVKKIVLDSNGNKIRVDTYEYIYDERGNWIQQTKYDQIEGSRERNICEVTTRKITYHFLSST